MLTCSIHVTIPFGNAHGGIFFSHHAAAEKGLAGPALETCSDRAMRADCSMALGAEARQHPSCSSPCALCIYDSMRCMCAGHRTHYGASLCLMPTTCHSTAGPQSTLCTSKHYKYWPRTTSMKYAPCSAPCTLHTARACELSWNSLYVMLAGCFISCSILRVAHTRRARLLLCSRLMSPA